MEGIVRTRRPPLSRFSLQIWPEDLGDGEIEWRGKVQHVTSGDARYFRDWATLLTFLEGSLGAAGSCEAHAGDGVGSRNKTVDGPVDGHLTTGDDAMEKPL
jgi:hypothetical protein